MDNSTAKDYIVQTEVYLDAEKFNEAISKMDKAIESDEDNPSFHILRGRACLGLNRIEEAVESFERALSIDSESVEALWYLGNTYIILKEPKKALLAYSRAVSYGCRNTEIFMRLGDIYLTFEDFDMALRNYSKAIREDETFEEARNKKIFLLIRLNRIDEALEESLNYVEVNPEAFNGYHYSCVILKSMGKYDEAWKILDRGKKNFPNDAAFEIDRLDILVASEKVDEAHSLSDSIITEYELSEFDLRRVYMERARIFAMENDPEGVLNSLQEAKKYSDEDVEIEYMLASCLLNSGRYDDAIETANKVVASEERDYVPAALYMIPFAYTKKGDMQKAREKYLESAEKLRDFAFDNDGAMDAYYFRGLCLEAVGENEKAAELAEFLVNVDPQNSTFSSFRDRMIQNEKMKNADE